MRKKCGSLRDSDSKEMIPVELTIDETVEDERTLAEQVLERLWSHVLALAELEDALDAVDDAQQAVGQHLSDVATAPEPVFREGLAGGLGVVEVSRHGHVGLHQDLATRMR